MEKIVFGVKGGDNEGYYEDSADVLERLGKVKIGWFSTRYLPTNEKFKVEYYYVKREYAPRLLEYYKQQDWASIAKLPREKEGTAYQLKTRYVPSMKCVGLEILEARTGRDGGYFNIVPPILYFDEEAEKYFLSFSNSFNPLIRLHVNR